MAPNQPVPRVLIVYYSRSGNTEGVANAIARASGAALEAIVTTRERRGLIGYLQSGFEAMSEREGLIHAPKHNPRRYDIVLLGTPTWAEALSSPVRAYLNRFVDELPDVGFFVTCREHRSERVIEQMTRISGKTPLATLALSERDLSRHASVYFGEFWEKVLCAWETRTTTTHSVFDRARAPTLTYRETR